MKNTWKKVLFSLGAIGLLGAGSLGLVNAQQNTSGGVPVQNTGYAVGTLINERGDNTLLNSAITLVNRIMSMLSVVALVALLLGGYKMITANGDEGKYKKGLAVLKQAAIGLLIIGLSWAIIRIIFWFINRTDNDTNYNN